MKNQKQTLTLAVAAITLLASAANFAFANGGPFVLKYPNGDPAAKGVLARLDPDLKPARETRLRVIKENLNISFDKARHLITNTNQPPLVHVSAEYTIENPTDEQVEVDFGFPILRGVYVNPLSMMPKPDVWVRLGKENIKSTIISNSAIYGTIRQRARKVIEKAVAKDPTLTKLVSSVKNGNSKDRKALFSHLTDTMKWNECDAALMVEYASIDFGKIKSYPPDRAPFGWWGGDPEFYKIVNENLGPLSAIGEQKATQFFAQLASCFDSKASSAYEAIFTAWGGDVRERSVDIKTGKVRPREITVDPKTLNIPAHNMGPSDPTIYARVDYLDPKAQISESEKASCKAILKNLPVIFTFAPMNILHYNVKFPAKSTQTLTVSYSQYAYSDTRSPSSYQLAYVVHPASLWKEFGPINLEATIPEGVRFRASDNAGIKPSVVRKEFKHGGPNIFTGTVKNKSGEIYLAVDAKSWKKYAAKTATTNSYNQKQLIAGTIKEKQR